MSNIAVLLTTPSAALVCQSWKTAAQRRLYAHVSMSTRTDLNKFASRLSEYPWSVKYLRILDVELYDRGIALDDQLSAAHLCDLSSNFGWLVQLRITTHRTSDDPDLVGLLGACSSLKTLLVRHRWGNYKTALEPYNIYSPSYDYTRCDPTADPLRRAGGYRVDTLADITSALCEAVPFMNSLQHLLLERVTWATLPKSFGQLSLEVLLLAQSRTDEVLLTRLAEHADR